jgi:hypothetical protein
MAGWEGRRLLTPYYAMRYIMAICGIKYILFRYCLTFIVCQDRVTKKKEKEIGAATGYKLWK